jgi:hypothetical protein
LGYVVVKYLWAALRVYSFMSVAAHRRQMEPHKRCRMSSSFLEKSKGEAPREFGQKLWEKFPQDVGENELVNNQFMKLGIIVLEQAANVFAPTPPVDICRAKSG